MRTYGLVAAGRGGLSAAEGRARQLRAEGKRVRVIVPGADCALQGVEVPAAYRVEHVHGDGPCERSDRLRLALEQMHREEPFAAIEFPSLGGWGYRAIQAKRAGQAFGDVALIVREEGTSAEQRRRERRWPDGLSELEGDHAERYAMANADAPSGHKLVDEPLVTVCVPYYNLAAHLPRTLASLAEQTYPHLEVLVIDDGSPDPTAQAVFDEMKRRFPHFRFLHQPNAGIGATRNRGLAEARGDYFLPMDADNVARPDMVERFVRAIHARPDVAAMTCYFLAFATDDDLAHGRFLHAYRPTGGPHVLAALRNVYGDATAICRTETLRAVGGWETDRGTSFEDWELFVKLVHAGGTIDVVPDHLFYYRHLPTGFSRKTDPFANHERVLRQFRRLGQLPESEREALWDLLAGMHRRVEQLEARQNRLRHRIVDRLHAACKAWFVPSHTGVE